MPVIYDITLEIGYRYERAAGSSRTLLRMLPPTRVDQQLLSGAVTVSPPPDFRLDRTDFFGNAMTEIAHTAPVQETKFRFQGRVRRSPNINPMDLSCPYDRLPSDLAATRSIDALSPHHFLGRSDRVTPGGDIADFAQSIAEPGMTTRALVQAVSSRLHSEMAFDPVATEVTTAPDEAFRARRGVCQDFSHIAISALRTLGIPAGYVSGFLRTLPPPGQERLEGADAMHAWVRAWCGAETGWVEIDPTNAIWAEEDHIVVAVGRDYADVAPVKGSLRATGGQKSTHSVDVVPVD
ncbi:transglutaminase family protein [Arenibacterium halophilum]|uniref:Transglutaminase family protein n=1 Tax=Arenibacterium halophilum TaxID=2583821 RepID=A0ABY2XE27_9RHOB|nr:transglutaminase family protein [Arenibacterium halophilum]TMV15277.1 transglutaminase family protein [Arenibacterium halophilum]